MSSRYKSSEDIQANCISNHPVNRLTFPYHILKCTSYDGHPASKGTSPGLLRGQSLFPFINPFRASIFPKVCAAGKDESGNGADGDNDDDEQKAKYSKAMEALAYAYIERESGWDRIKMTFQKDHRGKQDLELNYMELVIAQVFILTFFGKYIPAAKFARQEFIRENQGTVFKTRFQAIRRLQDHTFMKASAEAAAFSTKITAFSASFLLLSSTISSYRNKTSVLEYSLAAGITGGLARANMGIKGFIAGSVVGGVLGSVVGLLGYLSLSAYGITQEERHLENIKAKLEVLKSIEGEDSFRNRINEILNEDKTLAPIPVS